MGIPVKRHRVIIEEVEDEEYAQQDPWTTQTGADEFLKLPITRNRTCPSYKNKKALFKKIDQLPAGSEWKLDILTVEGDLNGPNGQPLSEELDLWRQCPVDAVRELMGNPAFRAYMAYAAVRMKRNGVRFYSEMNTGDWWGDVQTADILRRVGEGDDPLQYTTHGLRPVYEPFWADLPHTDIFACITPDILHQLHKGVIKEHLLQWVEKIVGKRALDERFSAMSKAHGLRHFPRGISILSQWTGGEAKEIEKILLGILVGRVSSRVLKAVRGLLDFVYYAQLETHSDTTLSQMRQALNLFHQNKAALIELGVREHFNIPKLHSLIHYVDAIMRLGCLDGVNTENSERLHIDYAKKAYRASSRREYLSQMTTWLQRQEAVDRRQAYLAWCTGLLEAELQRARESGGCEDVEDDDSEGQQDSGDEGERGGEGEADEDDDVDVEGEKQHDDGEVKALRQLVNSNVARAYHVPLTPSAHRVSLSTLTSSYGALDFRLELNDYLRDNLPSTPLATEHSRFDLYHSLTLLLPANIHISNDKRICRLRAAPAIPRIQDKKAVPARFDCALFVEDDELYRTHGGLTGEWMEEVMAQYAQQMRIAAATVHPTPSAQNATAAAAASLMKGRSLLKSLSNAPRRSLSTSSIPDNLSTSTATPVSRALSTPNILPPSAPSTRLSTSPTAAGSPPSGATPSPASAESSNTAVPPRDAPYPPLPTDVAAAALELVRYNSASAKTPSPT
ncbi:hypothetical protein BN946_scf184970.g72 [Trametes cinnabarina]|uniref:Uncharacterized protein n=1 Tax=Pycnoporus cinnabarinus TaxID=5643 RepID=A0A060SCY4_PYCCI|nr:hypothetical protein BN946_scf184970.g72 [Trametes cinnabarina]